MAHTSALSSLCATAAIFLALSLNTAVAQAQSNSSEHQSDSCMMCDFNDSTLMHNPDALEKTFIAFADRMQRQSPAEAAADRNFCDSGWNSMHSGHWATAHRLSTTHCFTACSPRF